MKVLNMQQYKKLIFFLAIVSSLFVISFLVTPLTVFAGYAWTEVQPGGNVDLDWDALDYSSDDSILLVAEKYTIANGAGSGGVYISTSSGATWSDITPTSTDEVWNTVASNASGTLFLAAAFSHRLYISTSTTPTVGSRTWTETVTSTDQSWRSVASNSDGSLLIVASGLGRIYISTSTDPLGPRTWTETQPAGNDDKGWISVVSSYDGKVLLAGINNGRLYISTSTDPLADRVWTETQPEGDFNKNWFSLASDSDGSTLVATTQDNVWISTSTDPMIGSRTWVTSNPTSTIQWYSAVTSDSDGSNLTVTSYYNPEEDLQGRVWVSADGGTTWTEQQPPGVVDKDWYSVASNSDGSKLIAGSIGNSDWGALGRLYMGILAAPPTVDIGSPSLTTASSTSSVTYTITYGGATNVTLASGDITLNVTNTATGTVGVSGTGTSTRTVTISDILGNGTLGITIASSTASNNDGDAPGAGPSTTFVVDTILPVVEFSIAKDFYGPNSFIVDVATTTATIIGHWSDANDATTADLLVRRSDTNEIWGNGNFETPWIESDPGIGNLGILGWFEGFFGDPTNIWFSNRNGLDYDPDDTFENGVTYTYTLRSIDIAGNTAEASDSFTWFPDSTTQVTAQNDIITTATSSAGNINITIPNGTDITKDDGSAFDATAITSTDATNVILGSSLMTAGVTLQGAVQFGISGITLHFSNPVTVRIPVTVPNGTILDIRRSPDGGATWTTAGFTASAADTCLNGNGSHPVTAVAIAGGFATIFTCQASDFATYSYSQPSSSSYYYGGGTTTTTSTSTATTTLTTTTTTSTTTASTTPSLTLQDLLASLIAQLKALILQAKAQGITVSPAVEALVQGNYTRDLKFGMTGEDVRQLQIYLNSKGFTVAPSGPGSLGNETTYFGSATRAALIKFQKASGISPASGYFGPKTRAYVEAHP